MSEHATYGENKHREVQTSWEYYWAHGLRTTENRDEEATQRGFTHPAIGRAALGSGTTETVHLRCANQA